MKLPAFKKQSEPVWYAVDDLCGLIEPNEEHLYQYVTGGNAQQTSWRIWQFPHVQFLETMLAGRDIYKSDYVEWLNSKHTQNDDHQVRVKRKVDKFLALWESMKNQGFDPQYPLWVAPQLASRSTSSTNTGFAIPTRCASGSRR